MSKLELAQAQYADNKRAVEKNGAAMNSSRLCAFAKDQDRLHLIICEEQDKLISPPTE